METDLRIIKTKNKIRDAFFSLVSEKGYSNVSISDIANRAQINRNTFYLHYKDKDDMVKKYVFEEQTKIDNTFNFSKIDFSKNRDEKLIEEGLTKLLKRIESKKDYYRIFLTDDSLSGYLNQIKYTFKKHIALKLNIENYKNNVAYEYVFSGFYGVLSQWVIESNTDLEYIEKILIKFGMCSLKMI